MNTRITRLTGGKIAIETSRLQLRKAHIEDVEHLHGYFSDAEVMRYWDRLPHDSKDQTIDWVNKMMNGPQNGKSDFVIVLKSTMSGQSDVSSAAEPSQASPAYDKPKNEEVVIGKAGIWQGNEVGFLIGRQYWGQGLANEAVSALLDVTFSATPAPVDGDEETLADQAQRADGNQASPADVVADVDPRNKACLKLLARLGFEKYATKEKTFRLGNEWVDSVYLRLTRECWLSKRSMTLIK